VGRWYTDGERALDAGEPLPDPADYRTVGRSPSAQTVALALTDLTAMEWWAGPTPAHGHRIDEVAAAFMRHRYATLRRGQVGRHGTVQADIDNDLLPFFARHGVAVIERVTNELVGKLAEYLAGLEAADDVVPPPLWPQLDGVRAVTLARAEQLEGTSRSTIKRWHKRGLLPSWHVDDVDGRVRIAVGDLRGAAARPAQRSTRRPLQTSTAGNKLGVLKMILEFAAARGIPLTGDPMAGIFAVAPEDVRTPDDELPHVPLDQFRTFAVHMPVVQQLAMWLERILGVRIGEGFGPHVGDVVDLGGDRGGYIVLDRQGGKPFLIIVDGERVVADEKERLKTRKSHRVIALPRQVMVMLRVVIAVFHTDPDTGEVDMTARLIPGLQQANRSGQSAHRGALRAAVANASFNTEVYGAITPKRLRACLVSDLERLGVSGPMARRYVGHIAGDDVHARYYLLDPAAVPEAMAEWRPVTEMIERLIDDELGGTLLVPTTVRQTFGTKHPLRARQQYIDATLAAHGWFIEPRTDTGEAMLGCEHVARVLGIALTTARRQLREGTIPGGVLVRKGGREVWMCPADEVEAHRRWLSEHPTTDDLAEELGLTYHQLYALIAELDITGLQRVRGGDLRLTPGAVTRLRSEQSRRQRLAERAMPLSVVAVELGIPVLTAETLLRRGVLMLDPESSTSRERQVTRESVEAFAATRATGARPADPDEPAVPDVEARAITGLTRPGLANMVTAGVLVPVNRSRRRYITVASIERWAQNAGSDDVLRKLASWQPASCRVG
jgi:hypothetical protein